MRHRMKRGRLSRNISARKALFKIMANDLFTYQRIETTKAKAKALRVFAEPLITLAKNNPDSVHAKRLAYKKLCDRVVVKSLFDNIGPLYKDVPGGYTRIMAMGHRKGDGAPMAIMELTKRTISDDDLLGKKAIAKPKTKTKEDLKSEAKEGNEKETPHAAPEVKAEEKEERVVEDKRKSQAKTEQKKVSEKGIFKRFRRKSIG